MPATQPPHDAQTTNVALADLIAGLSDPAAYPIRPSRIERVETHASVVFLADDDVYKLKKPVDFGFLDYSTPARRRQMAVAELELNRRLAPDVYLDVLDVVRTADGLRIGGAGKVVDCLVHMRRLPEAETLVARINREDVDEADIDAVARRIAAFHQTAESGPEIARWGELEAIRRNVEENFEQTEAYVGRTLPASTFETICSYARAFMEERAELFQQRVEGRMIRDGHGDLRAEHVYLRDDVTIVDCIEFNDRIRCGDVAADLGFLAMDLDALNRPDLSDRLVSSYAAETAFEIASVLDFYRCYRAYVRGKVASFRLEGDDGTARREARRYFHLAHRYATGARGPRLILMAGLTGSGKSTLARELAASLPSTVLDSDTTRKRLAGLDPSARQEVAFETGIYSAAMSTRVYQALLDGARERLQRGQTVILDATYLRQTDRQVAAHVARDAGAPFLIAHCYAAEEVTRERLTRRGTDTSRITDGRWEIYLAQRETADPFDEAEAAALIDIDTSQPLEAQAELVLGALESRARPA